MEDKSDGVSDEPSKMSFQLLKEITNNFDPERKLGSGASGEVYKGVFKDGKVIAVKKLRFMPWSNNKQFQNEFEHLIRLKHPNIVQLVGFCDEEEDICVQFEGKMVHAVDIHRALCLEYVPNGDLGKFLSDKYLGLSWHTRFKIIQGTCQGLKYLHELLTMHFDLKLENILLDEKMMPKIADFGLSRLLGEENTIMTKTPLGTIGYLPPEFINKQIISNKYDIFSLGVIIKKIMTGNAYFDISHMDDRECIEHVYNSWRKTLQELPVYPSFEADCKQVKTCIEIAVDCTQEDPRKRPAMNKIISRLSKGGKDKSSSQECTEERFQLHDGKLSVPLLERPFSVLSRIVSVELLRAPYYLASGCLKVSLISKYIRRPGLQTGQCSVISECSSFAGDLRNVIEPVNNPFKLAYYYLTFGKKRASVNLTIELKTAILMSLKASNGCITNGEASLVMNNVLEQFSWALRGPTEIEIMFVWHIATDYCENAESNVRGTDINTCQEELQIYACHQETAVTLSRYCAYLIDYAPGLLHGYVDAKLGIARMMKDVRQAVGYLSSMNAKYKVMHDLEDIEELEEDDTIFRKGVKLGRQLERMDDRALRWKLMADFWAERVIYIAKSSNVNKHLEWLAKDKELLAIVWLLVSHMGIVKTDKDHKKMIDRDNYPPTMHGQSSQESV